MLIRAQIYFMVMVVCLTGVTLFYVYAVSNTGKQQEVCNASNALFLLESKYMLL